MQAPAYSTVEQVPAPEGKPAKNWLTRTFNAAAKIGLGAAVGFGVKTAIVAAAGSAAAPALAIAAVAALAGGVSSITASFVRHKLDNRALARAGKEVQSYDWKKKGALAFGLGALGGGVFSYFSDTISETVGSIGDYFQGTGDATPHTVIDNTAPIEEKDTLSTKPLLQQPVEATKTITIAGICFEDEVQKIVNAPNTSNAVKEAASRACSTNPRIAAQGTKDLGFHLLNGIGIEKNAELGVKMLTEAAEAGNVQAIRDMAYLQFTGASGVERNVEIALAKMESVMDSDKTGLAKRLLEQWTDTAEAPDTTITDRLNTEMQIRETVEPLPAPTVEPAPEQLPAPQETSAISQHVAAAEPSRCKAIFNNNEVEFACPANDTSMAIGERIHVTRPPFLTNPAAAALS